MPGSIGIVIGGTLAVVGYPKPSETKSRSALISGMSTSAASASASSAPAAESSASAVGSFYVSLFL